MASLGRCWDRPVVCPPEHVPLRVLPVPPKSSLWFCPCYSTGASVSQLISTPSLRAWLRARHGLETLEVWGAREFQAGVAQVLSVCLFCGCSQLGKPRAAAPAPFCPAGCPWA